MHKGGCPFTLAIVYRCWFTFARRPLFYWGNTASERYNFEKILALLLKVILKKMFKKTNKSSLLMRWRGQKVVIHMK